MSVPDNSQFAASSIEANQAEALPVHTATVPNSHLTSGSRLAKNTIWNLLGNSAPMLVAVVCIPILIRGLGTDRFGVLTLVWALIGYANLFDFGLGRALTQLVAAKLGTGEDQEVPLIVWTSLGLMLALGAVGALLIAVLDPWLVHRVLHVQGALAGETVSSLYLLAISVPMVISTAGLRGLLEAYQRFGLITALRIPMGALTFVGPLLVLPFSRSLYPVVAVLVAGRALNWAAHLVACLMILPSLRRRVAWDARVIGPLFRFGSWMTVSNVVSPLMSTLDRFVIGSLISVGAVAYYATPYEVVTKFWILPGALLGVMFPAFSTTLAHDSNRASLLYDRTVKYLLLALFPLVLLVVALADNGLKLWLGAEFARHSAPVLRWLAVGVFINCLAWAPLAVLQGAGRPDVTAKLHLIELPIYLALLFWLTKTYGIEGAAMAWTGRVTLDAALLFILARRYVPIGGSIQLHTRLLGISALAVFVLATLPHSLVAKAIFILAVYLGFLLTTWFVMLSPQERRLAQGLPARLLSYAPVPSRGSV
jgi:O-antigen/teichoic acid export membrane protein